ncbi:MAG: TetR/AcrR family transcriptional regulator, partial [Acidobacteriota bacterium]
MTRTKDSDSHHRDGGSTPPDSTPKPDRRVTRTKRLLRQALMELVREKDYARITVQDILDRADVGRSTFYTHYRDKDDLLLG